MCDINGRCGIPVIATDIQVISYDNAVNCNVVLSERHLGSAS